MPFAAAGAAHVATRETSGRDRVRLALDAAGVALITLYVCVFALRNVSLQADLRTYLAAAEAASAGRDPYRLDVLASVAGRTLPPFLYPPVALALFLPLSRLDLPTAAALWIGIKILLVAGLVALWRRWFVPGASLLPLCLVAVFGWNQSGLWDLRNGNIAWIECALLWTAFTCFATGRRTAFAALVVACACIKITPAVFLLLLLVPVERARPEPGRFLAAVAAVVTLVAGPMLVEPVSHWQRFFVGIPDTTSLGDGNPGALGLVAALARIAGLSALDAARWAPWAWSAHALLVLAVSAPFLRRAWRARDARTWVVAAAFLFVLLHPRPMAYGFVLLAPAPFFFPSRLFGGRVGQLLLALGLSAQGLLRAAGHQSSALFYVYSPALLALLLWLLILESGSGDTRRPDEAAGVARSLRPDLSGREAPSW